MEDEQELVCFVSNGAISRWNYMPTVPDCVSHMLIKRQRTVQNDTQDFKFISRGYCAASDSLWKL